MRMVGADKIDLADYHSVMVDVSAADGVELPSDARKRLASWLEGVFSSTRDGALPLDVTHEWGKGVLVLQIVVTRYDSGWRFGRSLVIGVDTYEIFADFFLKDGQAGRILIEETIGTYWEREVNNLARKESWQKAEVYFVDVILDGMKKLDWSRACNPTPLLSGAGEPLSAP